MMVYYSVLTLEELADLSRDERKKYIGVISNGKILQPARCYECESEIVILEEDTTVSQCVNCGIINDVYFYSSINPLMSKVLSSGFVGVNFHEDMLK